MKWFIKVMKQYADFSGRARRKEYWYFALFNTIAAIVAVVIDIVAGWDLTFNSTTGLPNYGPCYQTYMIAALLPAFAVAVRRLHDVGKSGWWMFIALIPIVGGIWLLILLCTDGQSEQNHYGADPKYVQPYFPKYRREKSIAVTFIIGATAMLISLTPNWIRYGIIANTPFWIWLVNIVFMLLFGIFYYPAGDSYETAKRQKTAFVLLAIAALIPALRNILLLIERHIPSWDSTTLIIRLLCNLALLALAVLLFRSERKNMAPIAISIIVLTAISIITSLVLAFTLYIAPQYIALHLFAIIMDVALILLAVYCLQKKAAEEEEQSSISPEPGNLQTPISTEVIANDGQPDKTDIDQPAVILIVRDKRFVGSNATVTVELNGVRIGTMRNNSFLLCKTTMANNTITLKEFKKDIHIQAKSGEKTLLHYHYSGINAVHTEIESGVEYQKLQEAIKGIKGLGVGRLLLDLLVGGFFIWGGASEVLVLRFTNKYSGVVVILGVIIALGGIVSFVRRLRKENAAVMLDRFLKEAGHPESSNERKY